MKRSFGPRGRGRKLGSLFAAFSTLLLVLVILQPAQAALDRDLFELDKNAQDDVTTFRDPLPAPFATGPLGTLRSNINATQTSFEVCQASNANPTAPFTILVDAEQMTVGAISSPGGGGCSGAFKRLYSSVTRGVDITPPPDVPPPNVTTAAAHAGGENVTLLTVGAVNGDDWDQVYAAVTADPDTTCAALGAVACTFVSDPREESIFTSSKDFDEISDWEWRDQSVPDSDELDDGFAVKYVDDDQNLYFGADRFATNGSKDAGFWFFHDEVATVEVPGADGTFTGEHTAPSPGANGIFCNEPGNTNDPSCSPYDADDTGGDILILTTFTNGGAAVTIRIFEWFGPGGSDAALFQRGLVEGDCVPGSSTQSLCATVNDTTIESPWSYDGKGEPVDDEINAGGFLEGGINLSDLGLAGCFSSFMATSRSAPQVTADPKDFILGSFEACASELTTTPADGSGAELVDGDDPDTLPETQIGTGDAGVDVTDLADVVVTGAEEWSGTLSFFLCGPIADPDTCTDGGVPIGSPVAIDQDTDQPIESASANLTEVGRYCWRGEFTSDDPEVPGSTDASEGECFEVDPVTPELTTTAVAESEGLSPTIFGSLADLNGDGVVDGDDDSNAFYGDTSIIDGALDCNAWLATPNAGAQGDGTIDGNDNCTLIGFDGTADGVTIGVVAGEFATADPDGTGGPLPPVPIADGTALPTVFNAAAPNNDDIGDSDFAWSTIFGRVDSNGDEAITGDDCHFGIIGDADILGSDPSCGFGVTPPAALNGHVDLNGDGNITQAGDSCSDGCFFGHDVFNGLVAAGPVDFGEPLFDVATLTGTANQPGTDGPGDVNGDYTSINATMPDAANGSITFTLVGPDPDASTTECTELATGAGTNPQVVAVTGDGDYITSGFTPDAPGDYHWKASYDGDSPNTLGTSHNDACDEVGEDVTVRQIPTEIMTKQSWFPNDTATITSSVAGDLLEAGGTVEFSLYGTSDCTGEVLYTETETLTGGANSEEVGTSNGDGVNDPPDPPDFEVTTDYTDAADSEAGPFSWKVVYTPAAGDTAHTGIQSACDAEHFSITYTNDPGPGTDL
jgi:hypothetical protein